MTENHLHVVWVQK